MFLFRLTVVFRRFVILQLSTDLTSDKNPTRLRKIKVLVSGFDLNAPIFLFHELTYKFESFSWNSATGKYCFRLRSSDLGF